MNLTCLWFEKVLVGQFGYPYSDLQIWGIWDSIYLGVYFYTRSMDFGELELYLLILATLDSTLLKFSHRLELLLSSDVNPPYVHPYSTCYLKDLLVNAINPYFKVEISLWNWECEGPNWLGQILVELGKMGLGSATMYFFNKKSDATSLKIGHLISLLATYIRKLTELDGGTNRACFWNLRD